MFKKKPKLITFIAVLIIVVGSLVAWLINSGQSAPEAVAGWYNDSWSYRRSFTIDNKSGSVETMVYASTTIDTSDTAKFQTDCGDLRFTDNGGNLLDYFIFSGCGTAATSAHVQFASLPTNTSTIYFYYGNPSIDNGFASTDFTTEASNYQIGTIASEEQGTGPVLYVTFDEGFGQTANDLSPNSNDCTLGTATTEGSDDPTWISEAKHGRALRFDGSDDYLDCGNGASLDFTTNEFSVSVWFKAYSLPGTFGGIIDKGTGNLVDGYGIQLQSDGFLAFVTDTNGASGGKASSLSNEAIQLGYWYHVVVKKEASNKYMFINGVQQDQVQALTLEISDSSRSLLIGKGDSDSGYEFEGDIDEVKVYNYARSADQINQDFNQGSSVFFGATADQNLTHGLVGWWPLDESVVNSCTGGSNDACDASGNGNDATWEGNAIATSTARYAKAVELDGVDDYVYLPHSGGSEITYSMWLKKDFTNQRRAIKKGGTGSGEFIMIFPSGGGFGVYLGGGLPSPGYYSTIGFDLGTSNWQHIAWTYDKTTLKLYINGEFNRAIAVARTTDFNSDIIRVGEPYGLDTEDFDGNVDEIRVYNRVLGPEEVRHLYEWAPGPVAHWKFDENNGTSTAFDTAASSTLTGGNHGTIHADMTEDDWVPGKYGSALEFDGTNDNITVDFNTNLNFTSTTSFTLVTWFNAKDSPSDGNVMGIVGKAFKYGIDLFYASPSDTTFQLRAGTRGVVTNQTTYNDLVFNRLYHVAYVYKAEDQMELYLDGILVDSQSNTADTSFANNASLFIADSSACTSGTCRDFIGIIDDVRIYNYARTPRQVLEDMHAGQRNNPIGYWSFDEGQGTTANDYGVTKLTTASGNDGTLTGMSTTGTSTAWTVYGKSGSALQFDGVDDYVALSSGQVMNASSSAISLWFRSSDFNGMLVGKDADSDTYIRALDSTTIRVQTDTVSTFKDFTVPEMSLERWYHLVVIRNDGTTKVYLNGEESSSGGQTQIPDLTIDQIGRYTNGAAGFWYNGMIDEVKIYNYVITLDEIRENYNQGKQALLSRTPEEVQNTYEGLVGWWKMDEPSWSGNTDEVIDYSGAGNHGTSVDNANSTSTAKFGRAGEFDGSGDYITIADSGSLDAVTGVTLEGWIYKTANPTVNPKGLIEKTTAYGLRLGTDGKLDSAFNTVDSGWNSSGGSNTAIGNNSWNHVALTYDSNSGLVKLYLNGVIDGTSTTNVGGNLVPGSGALRIARETNNRDFLGEIDEVKVYNYARSPDQIMRDFVEGPPSIGYWKFDDMSGTATVDSSGRGSDGTYIGNVTWVVRGKKGSALDFDGVDDYVEVPGFDPHTYEDFTISLWMKSDILASAMPDDGYFWNHKDATEWVSFGTTDDGTKGHMRFFNKIDGGIEVYYSDTDIVSDQQWHHVAVVRDKTNIRFYVDGIPDGIITDDDAGLSIPVDASTGPTIGDDYNQSEAFAGLMDEVKVFDYALTQRQIMQEYNGGGPIGYWKFDKGEGETAYDYSGNSNDGTVFVGTGGSNTATTSMWTNGATGKINGSLDFDGTDDRVNTGNVQNILGLGRTYVAWLNTDDESGDEGILHKNPITGTGWDGMTIEKESANLAIYINGAVIGTSGALSNNFFDGETGNWIHMAITLNTGGTISIYKNGVLQTNDLGGTYTTPSENNDDLFIGWAQYNDNQRYFNGKIDEVKVYNYALTPEEVRRDYNGGFATYFK